MNKDLWYPWKESLVPQGVPVPQIETGALCHCHIPCGSSQEVKKSLRITMAQSLLSTVRPDWSWVSICGVSRKDNRFNCYTITEYSEIFNSQ